MLGTVLEVHEFVPMVVSEFYCNLTKEADDPDSEDYHKVFVRGELLEFSPELINEFLGCTVEGEFEEISDWSVVSKELTDNKFEVWPHNPQTIPASKLTQIYRALFKILIHNWMPSKHRAAVTQAQGRFLYHIGTGRKFNFGKFVFDKLISGAESSIVKGLMCYPSLIYGIIKKQKQDVVISKDMVQSSKRPLVIKLDPEVTDEHLRLQFKKFIASRKDASHSATAHSSQKQLVLRFLENSLEFHAQKISGTSLKS